MDRTAPADATASAAVTVRRRRVIYVPGYDPFHARRYRELYRAEAKAQAAISGFAIEVRAAPGADRYGWAVSAEIDGARVDTEVTLLEWSDIVQRSMERGIWQTYLQAARTLWVYSRSGALGAVLRLRKGPAIAALYPAVVLLLQLAVALAVAFGLGWLIAQATPRWVALAGLFAVWPVLRWFARHDSLILARYLLHNYAFSSFLDGAYPPALEARIAAFEDVVAEALGADVDEVLVVGHSSGAQLAISMLADLIRDGKLPQGGPALSLLTLGQVVPMVSFLPAAARLRGDLHFLSANDALAWVDVSAPGDGCTFALCDPAAVSGVAPREQRGPLILSAAFRQTLSPERWRALRWRFFRLHFQYLCAFDRPGDYDYFRITAGPKTLAQRFAGRKSSASAIRRPVSRHRTMERPDG